MDKVVVGDLVLCAKASHALGGGMVGQTYIVSRVGLHAGVRFIDAETKDNLYIVRGAPLDHFQRLQTSVTLAPTLPQAPSELIEFVRQKLESRPTGARSALYEEGYCKAIQDILLTVYGLETTFVPATVQFRSTTADDGA